MLVLVSVLFAAAVSDQESPYVFAGKASGAPPIIVNQPADSAGQSRNAPVPRQPLLNLFFYEDYPAALSGRKGRRGAVSMKLTVGPNGRVIGCNIASSSGEPVLDAATCNILRRRSLFTPASDAQGQPTIGTVDVLVDWDAIFRKFGQR